MSGLNWYIVLTVICILLCITFIMFILLKKKKKTVDYYFIIVVSMVIVWASINLTEAIYLGHNAILTKAKFLLIIFCTVIFLFASYSFIGYKVPKTIRLLTLFLPSISSIVLITNGMHHLFFVNYSIFRNELVYGGYFYIHTMYSYLCLTMSIYNFMAFSIKTSGFLSRQAFLLMLGTIIPMVVNVLYVFDFLIGLDPTPIAFAGMLILYWLAVINYDFLKIAPIAHKGIMDNISDGFIIIDNEYKIIQYNKAFYDNFSKIFDVKLKSDILKLFEKNPFRGIDIIMLKELTSRSVISREREIFNCEVDIQESWKAFTIEISPVFVGNNHKGTIMLFKDITQRLINIDIIKRNEAKLLRAEKYSFLGELSGGLTHIIKNKISSISYYAMFFEYILPDYLDLINRIEDPARKQEELVFHEEMRKRVQGIHEAVKSLECMVVDVTRQVSELAREEEMQEGARFTLRDFLGRIGNFAEMEAKEGYAVDIEIEEGLSEEMVFRGVLANFVQVVMNLLLNSVYEYKKLGVKDRVVLKIERSKETDSKILFSVIDFGSGIPKDVKDVLFTRMVTTKGNEGAGISLYTSASVVREKLNGEIKLLDTEKGAHFLISLNCV